MGNVINVLLSPVEAPSGLWVIILNWIEGSIVNYGWTIILFTLLLKFAMSPLDFFMKLSTKKNVLLQQKLAPQMAKLQKKYGKDQKAYQAQASALQKREGGSPIASCLVTLITLVLSMVIFLTVFSSLREVSAYKTICQYDNIESVYTQTMTASLEASVPGFDAETTVLSDWLKDETNQTTYETEIANAKSATKDAVIEAWKDSKDSWLWISNIWVSDGAKSALPTRDDLLKLANSAKRGDYKEYVDNLDTYIYDDIASIVGTNDSSWNGYYILAILAAVITFLSQYIAQLTTKLKKKELNRIAENPMASGGMMKFMKILLPAMMVIFVLSSSAAFGLYVVTNSIISILLTLLISIFVNLITKKKEEEVTEFLEKEASRQNKKLNKQKGN